MLFRSGSAELVCITGCAGARLEITYKGAHAQRPADLVEVDDFVGVKSHRAKGKRLTTYEVASLRFIEPELPQEPAEASADDPAAESAGLSGEASVSAATPAAASVPTAGSASESAAAPAAGAPLEIERSADDPLLDPAQLDLF